MPTVTEFLAKAHGKKCVGMHSCRACASPCSDKHGHWLWPAPPRKEKQLRPGSHFVCEGCWLYRRSRVTVRFLDGTYQDRQEMRNHSWLLTHEGLIGIHRPVDKDLLTFLLKPPTTFALSLMEPGHTPNLIQLAVLNDNAVIEAKTPLYFTLNGNRLEYTVYELQEAMEKGDQGKEPGVRILLAACGGYIKKEEKRERGRPPVTNNIKRVVTASGQAIPA